MVGDLTRRILRCVVSHSAFLRFKTSQMAAAALMLAMNLHQSSIAKDVGLPCQLKNLNERSSCFEASPSKEDTQSKGPLKNWNAAVRRLTNKCVGRDVMPCYKVMIRVINEFDFEGQLSADASLFPGACVAKTNASVRKAN